MTMKATIEVTGLRKRFGSAAAGRHVVHGAADQVTGLVGPNGEGKSTTMRVIAGLLAAIAPARRAARMNMLTAIAAE